MLIHQPNKVRRVMVGNRWWDCAQGSFRNTKPNTHEFVLADEEVAQSHWHRIVIQEGHLQAVDYGRAIQ